MTRAKFSLRCVTDVTVKKAAYRNAERLRYGLPLRTSGGNLSPDSLPLANENRELPHVGTRRTSKRLTAVERVLYQTALNGDASCIIFYLKAHRPIYRDKLNIDVKQLHIEIEQRLAELRENPELLARFIHATIPH